MLMKGDVMKWRKYPTKYCALSRLFLGSQNPMQSEYS